MKRALKKFLSVFLLFTILFMVMKVLFMAVYHSLLAAGAADWLRVIWHGIPMDMSVAGYLTVIPGLLITAALIWRKHWPERALGIYMGVVSLMVALIYCLDLGLYGYWGFRLDMTPLFYFYTSPPAAMASMEWWHWLALLAGVPLLALAIRWCYRRSAGRICVTPPEGGKMRWGAPLVTFLCTAALIIPIRGSVTVSTMNLSRAYFSTNQRLNHAAINPAFSLLYSATHQNNFQRQYRFMEDDRARQITQRLLFAPSSAPADTVAADAIATPAVTLKNTRPDIVVVVLESFSAYLLPSLGGEQVAVGLDSIARDGVSFTDIYASSYRTDRGLAAIFSAFPGPTSTSLLKYPDKFEHFASFPRLLNGQGYTLEYYYGGDANFTNMLAYLRSMGFSTIISDKDFPASQRTSKWGAHDDILFSRAIGDLTERAKHPTYSAPRLTVIQTSSSHEPFKVPYTNPRFADARLNAYAYTDSCVTAFTNALRTLPSWHNTLVVFVADHWGCYPDHPEPMPRRHHIPLILSGGALNEGGVRIDRLGMQTDLGATLLALLDIDHSSLRYSRNILDPSTPPVAVFTEPSLVGVITPGDTLVYDPDADRVVMQSIRSRNLPPARAFMRDLYHTLDEL